MTLALHPTNPLCFYWTYNVGYERHVTAARKTCSVCRYELIDGWCSRCDLENEGVLV